ncbi:MAG TPA: hypothetical protein VFD16_01170 [Candidatus Saccharimonadales bacterium]|nr:hypothetical protein [Candidatus Saccharimonadales bacterium]
MKKVNCNCGRNIEVRGGIVGLTKRFPQEIYICECGTAYIPTTLGCLVFNRTFQENNAEPEVLTKDEYQKYKEEELKVAKELGLRPEEAIIEIPAKELFD